MSEFFPPTEQELDQMILEVQQKMNGAENQQEYDQLHDKLKELREQKRQLTIKNNIL